MGDMFEKIGRYKLVFLIGCGGMGEVWSVVDPELGIPKAMKVLRPSLGWDDQYRALFSREADVAAQLGRHPGFPAIHDYDASGELPFLVMDYIDGVNLRALIPEGGFSEGVAVHVMRALFRALRIAHNNRRGNSQANVVHGDLKPENIMVSSHGDVFLTDFGISRFVEGTVVTASVIGTVPYMAPETFDGVVRVESDLFAAGLILHELLSGERVHRKQATVLEVKRRYRRGIPRLPRPVHPELEDLRQLLLQLDVDQRLPSAEDALDKLARVDVVDRRDELADQYLRRIGPPHTGLTQYLQALDSPGSFLPEFYRSRDTAPQPPPATVSVVGHPVPSDDEGPGHTVAVPEEELRALREGGSAPRRVGSSPQVEPKPEPEPEPGRGWPMLVVVLLASIGSGVGFGLLWFAAAPSPPPASLARMALPTVPSLPSLGAQPASPPSPEPPAPLPASAPAPAPEPKPAPRRVPTKAVAKGRVVFYVGAGHAAAAVKVGRKTFTLADLHGEPSFTMSLAPGRVRLSFCDPAGDCRRYGTIRVPSLEPEESLFVNLRHPQPNPQRRGGPR